MNQGVLDNLERISDGLAEEFSGIFSKETVERLVGDTADAFSKARVTQFVPIFVSRYARERLQAAAQASGRIAKTVPELLFVCVHNAGRSQMAAALLDYRARGRAHARCAGSEPASGLYPGTCEVMAEIGVSIAEAFPKPLRDELVEAADVVVTMGCGDACAVLPGRRYEEWGDLPDASGMGIEQLRTLRDQIDRRVSALLSSLGID